MELTRRVSNVFSSGGYKDICIDLQDSRAIYLFAIFDTRGLPVRTSLHRCCGNYCRGLWGIEDGTWFRCNLQVTKYSLLEICWYLADTLPQSTHTATFHGCRSISCSVARVVHFFASCELRGYNCKPQPPHVWSAT